MIAEREAPLKYRFRVKPYKHQAQGLGRVIEKRSYGLFWEPGTGKSKTAVDYAGYLALQNSIKAVLIICPLSVAGVWGGVDGAGGEIRKNFPVTVKRRIINLAGVGTAKVKETLAKAKELPGVIDFYIINYDSVWRVLPELRRHFVNVYGGDMGTIYSPRGYIRTSGNWNVPSLDLTVAQVEMVEGTCPVLVIADESHLIKHRTTQRSRSLHQLTKLSPYRLALTGTPITNSPLDAYSQFLFVNPQVFGLNWKAFESEYVLKGGYGQFQITGYRKLDDFQRRLHSRAMVVKKKDALDLPEKVFQPIPVELSPKTRQAYNKMAKEMVAEIEEYVENEKQKGTPFAAVAQIVLTKLLRLSQLTSGFVTDSEGAVRRVSTEKLTTAIDLISNLIDEGEKVVVFYRFKPELADLSLELGKKGIKYRVIANKARDRARFVDEFQSDPTPMVLLCQLGVGMGFTVTAANTAIFYNLDYSTDHYTQSQDRLHRIGQTRKVTYYQLLATRSIDHDVLRSLNEKKSVAETCLRSPQGIREFLRESLAA